MKHIKKYNEAKNDAFHFDPDMTLIKEIILELKHEYPSIEGDIVVEKFDTDFFSLLGNKTKELNKNLLILLGEK